MGNDFDVLIVGAGPTGLMLANQLARRGVSFAIVDRHEGPVRETRALGVQARTIEIYDRMGVSRRALAEGLETTAANLWANGRKSARLPLGDIGRGLSPYPFVLILGQDANERLLGDALREHGGDVRWRSEVIGLKQNASGVTAMLKKGDGSSEKITARWVAGCDGARSSVRTLTRVPFPGAPYGHVFFVADVVATGSMVAKELNVYLMADAFHLFFPMRGENRWRIVGILPKELRAKEGVTFDDLLPDVRAQVGQDLSFSECFWFSTYRIHHRRAERLREGRCFLLGDAAHVHSPVGAQGMNTGLQDAYNLGWKLALVAKGDADERLLDSYEAERLPVAERLLSTTDNAFTLIVSEGWIGKIFRTKVAARAMAFAMRVPFIRRLAFRTISQIGIAYRTSPLSETEINFPFGAPRAGDRFPWMNLRFAADGPVEDLYARFDDTRFRLLVFGQPASAQIPADFLTTLEIPENPDNARERARVGIPAPSFFLLRPDGHIAFAGRRLEADAIFRYFAGKLGRKDRPAA